MSNAATPRFENAYQVAKWAAGRLHQHNGATSRELYERFLPEFAAVDPDAKSGAAMVTQHLRKLEDDGLVVCEKSKNRSEPARWYWTGPLPVTDATKDPTEPVGEAIADDAQEITVVPTRSMDTNNVGDDPEPSPGINAEPLQEKLAISDLDDWDRLGLEFAARGRRQSALRRIEDVEAKVGALRGLQPILSDDIGALFEEICRDLAQLGAEAP